MTQISSVEQVYAADRLATEAGISGASLMNAAGRACAGEVIRRWPEGKVFVLAGPGANGGDGFVAARVLRDAGREVEVALLARREAMTGDAGEAAKAWTGPTFEVDDTPDMATRFASRISQDSIVVDALFGAGLNRPLGGAAAAFARLVPETRAPVVSVDVPSGVFGNSGRVDDGAFEADVTVTFGVLKPAHVLEPAASSCGDVVVADIGIPDAALAQAGRVAQLNAPALWSRKLPWPDRRSHKHTRGRLAVFSGPPGRTGAARLAARSGLRAGAGAVTLYGRADALPELAADSVAVMTRVHEGSSSFVERTERATAYVIGPAAGLTMETRQLTLNILRSGKPCVLDADALTIFREDPRSLIDALHDNCVLTPHTAEFDRIFPGFLDEASDKLAAVSKAVDRSGAVVLLKGADTVIGAPGKTPNVNVHSSPFLATAGSGDVLAGIIGGLLAQGMSTHDAARAGAWIHGDAGLRLGAGMIAEDLVEILPRTLRDLHAAVNSRK